MVRKVKNRFGRIVEAFTGLFARRPVLVLAMIGLLGLWAATEVYALQPSSLLEGSQSYLPVVARRWDPGDSPATGGLLITEVLYDPEGTEPGEEWIEIYNPGDTSVDLGVYKLGDEETAGGGEGMLQFPPGDMILSGQVMVVANRAVDFSARYGFTPDYEMRETDPLVPTLLKHAAWASGTVVLLNSSDEVLLLDDQDELEDALSWGNSTFAFVPAAPDVAAGHSLERVPADRDTDSAGDWFDQEDPKPGEVDLTQPTATPMPTPEQSPTATGTPDPTEGPSPTPTQSPPPGTQQILLSEVLYDPEGPEPGNEWVELFNPGPVAVSLDAYMLGDEEEPGGGEGMYRFPAGMMLSANQVLVLAGQASEFGAAYGFAPDYEFNDTDPAVPDMIKATEWASGSISLGNAGDELLVLGAQDLVVDALSWGSSIFAFDPAAPDVGEGHSLARQPADQDTDTAMDWVDESEPSPGSVSLQPPSPTPVPSQTPTPGSVTATPTGPPPQTSTNTPEPPGTPTPTPAATATPDGSLYLLISEVYYDASGSDPQEEWIEVYNPSGSSIGLSGYKIGDEEISGGGEGMYAFPTGAEILPGEKIVVALNAVGFQAIYGFAPDYEVGDSDPNVPDLLAYPGWGSGAIALSNSGDEVVLLDGQDLPVDVVTYEAGDFPGVVPHPGVASGHSLERSPASQDTDDCSLDFADQPAPSPGN